MTTENTGPCPSCNGSGRMPCPSEIMRRYGRVNKWWNYKVEDDCVTCTNCGGQTMSGAATGVVRLNPTTGKPCQHDFTGRTIGRCLTEHTCKHCMTTYVIDSGD